MDTNKKKRVIGIVGPTASGKTALMAIGAFHILGENGLAQKLARAGYHVEEIGR